MSHSRPFRGVCSTAVTLLGVAALIGPAPIAAADAQPSVLVEVDVTDIARRLAHATITIPDALVPETGPLELYYVEWTPGNHNPSGPIQNVVSFTVEDSQGQTIFWRRDEVNPFLHLVPDPPAEGGVRVRLSYITNQPGVNSRSSDTYGFSAFGGLNWNTVLVYPGGVDRDDLRVVPSIQTRKDWSVASGLRFTPARQGLPGFRVFDATTLAELVDSPAAFGRHLKSHELDSPSDAPHWIDAVAARADRVEIPDWRIDDFNRMLAESEAVFGPFPYARYHFLVLLDDALPGFGLEHCTSTYISMRGDRFKNLKRDDPDAMTIMPHEYVHCWVGKLVAPEGLLADDYHTPARTSLMWVYEGLTSYYDEVIAVRSGLMTQEEYVHSVTNSIRGYERQAGRAWRSVEDTALALRYLRAPSEAWQDLRRRQDYYGEGALFWATADAIIRGRTGGAKSLDDFAVAMFRSENPGAEAPGVPARTYTRADIVAVLSAIYSGEDWDALIARMIELPAAAPQFDLPGLLGHRLDWVDEPTALQKKAQKDSPGDLRDSLGISVSGSGEITTIIPGSPADLAGLAHGMKVIAVQRERDDGEDRELFDFSRTATTFSASALRDAVERSKEEGAVGLIIADGEDVSLITIEYEDGLLWPRLVRDESKPDILSEIMKPRAAP